MKKIFISGVSGSGKTTLAKYIAARYRIPFINGSSKVLWEKYNVKSHKDLITKCNEDHKMAVDFQYELLEYRKEQLKGVSEFVTDRAPLDNLVYYLLQISHMEETEATNGFVEACESTYDLFEYQQIFIDMEYYPIEDDGYRIVNAHYQRMVNCVFKDIIRSGKLIQRDNLTIVNDWGWEDRVKLVEDMFKPKKQSRWQNLQKKLKP